MTSRLASLFPARLRPLRPTAAAILLAAAATGAPHSAFADPPPPAPAPPSPATPAPAPPPPAAAPPATAPATPAATPAAKKAPAPIPRVPIGFSKLIVRLDGRDEIGIASADFHIRLLERMRSKGFVAVGAENLVFGKDESRRAEFLLGGTLREVECVPHGWASNCRIGIEWQVLDVARDEVVYTALTRAVVYDTSLNDKEKVAGALVDGALDSLLGRDMFRRTLAKKDSDANTPAFSSAAIGRCAPGRRVSVSAEDLLEDSVVVKDDQGHGSGVFVSPEGLVLTAAHVVGTSALKVRLHDGTEVEVLPVRVNTREDVALLRPVTPLANHRCAVLRLDSIPSGSELYAVGAPQSLDLAFSLTRGIVSGFPVIAGKRRLQTDASVNMGNSGGPLADDDGAVLGVVSFKIVATTVEGLAFAVPSPEALAALGLHVADRTDPSLLTEISKDAPKKVALFQDMADEKPSLDPEADRLREERRLQEEQSAEQARQATREREREEAIAKDQDARTPKFVPFMRWGGAIVGLVGVAIIPITFSEYNTQTTTLPQYDGLRRWNTVGWVLAPVGIASFAVSFAFRPAARPNAVGVSSIHFGPEGLSLGGTF